MAKNITKEKIIETVIQLGETKPLLQITLLDIAKQLGIKTPSLYNHIAGLDDLYTMLCLYACNQLSNTLRDSVIGISGKEALFKLANEYYTFANEQVILQAAIENPLLEKSRVIDQAKEHIVNVILLVMDRSALDHVEKIHLIRILRSYIYGFSILNNKGLMEYDVSSKDSFTIGIQAILSSFNI